MSDIINHPPHYMGSNGVEAIAAVEGFELGFRLGNAVAYILRADRKGRPLEDLKKAQFYLAREIAIREIVADGEARASAAADSVQSGVMGVAGDASDTIVAGNTDHPVATANGHHGKFLNFGGRWFGAVGGADSRSESVKRGWETRRTNITKRKRAATRLANQRKARR